MKNILEMPSRQFNTFCLNMGRLLFVNSNKIQQNKIQIYATYKKNINIIYVNYFL